MLRILVISLLVANLLLLGFQCSKPEVQKETTVKQTVVEDTSIPTIHLLGELMQDQDLMSGNRQCFSLGPFHSSEDRDDVHALLQEVSASISERETQALVEKGYWVFMSPYASLLEANQVLLSLQALGLKDIGVMYNGEWKNAISLGYFLRQENAQRRKKSLEERDYAPSIRVQRQSESRYWLDYEQYPGSELITLDMQNRPNDFMQRRLPCPEQSPFEDPEADPEISTDNMAQVQIAEEEPELPSEEVVETQPEEADGSSSGESGGSQAEEVDDTPVDEGEAVLEQAQANEPEISVETEKATPENLADDTEQTQSEITEVDDGLPPEENGDVPPEETDGPPPAESVGIVPEESADDAPVSNDEVLPGQEIATDPEDFNEAEPENSDDVGSANSVGTGPEIGFGAEPESGNETESENDKETDPETGDDTETDGG